MYKVAITGHRPDKIGGYTPNPMATYIYKWLTIQMVKIYIEHDHVEFISGMALGADTLFASIASKMKEARPGEVRLVCAIPFEGHGSNWPNASRKFYDKLLKRADEVVIVSEGGFTPQKMQRRNEWMVDHCDELLAVWNGDQFGGTWNCIAYAKEKEKLITYIDAKRLRTYQQIAKRLAQTNKERNK